MNAIIRRYTIRYGTRVVRIAYDRELGRAIAVTYVNNGETACASKSFRTLSGAQAWGTKWLIA